MKKGYRIGKLLITTCNQAANAPLIDGSRSTDADGLRYKGIAVRLQPWKREFGQSAPQLAAVIAWRLP